MRAFKPFSLAESIQAGQAIKMNQLKIQQAQLGMERQERLRGLAQMSQVPTYDEFEAETFPGEAPISGLKEQVGTEYSPEVHAQRLAAAGETEMAAKLQDQIAKMSEADRTAAADRTEQIGRLAIYGDTPEKWEEAVSEAVGMGLIPEGGEAPTFDQREMIIAQSQQTSDMLKADEPASMRGISTTIQKLDRLATAKTPEERAAMKKEMMELEGRNKFKKIGNVWNMISPEGKSIPLSTEQAELLALSSKESAKASGKIKGESKAEAKIDLPKLKSDAENLKSIVRSALDHPGFPSVVGMPSLGKLSRFVGGTEEAGFDKVHKQIVGKTFMEAYKTLKGGGQITEVEGQKATEALQRLDTKLSEKEYIAAAEEFISEIDRLMLLAEQRATDGNVKESFEFSSVEDAEAANLPPGTEITVGGRKAVVR